MLRRLKEYPAPVMRPTERALLVRTPRQPERFFAVPPWTWDPQDRDPWEKPGKVFRLRRREKGWGVGVTLVLGTDTTQELERNLESSYRYHARSARPSTWKGGAKPLEVPGADFVANFGRARGQPNTIWVQMRNVRFRAGEAMGERPPPDEELARIAGRLAFVFSDPPDLKARPPAGGMLRIRRAGTEQGKAALAWAAGGSLADSWVLIRTSAGRLAAGDGDKVLLGEVPRGGAVVRVIASSPDCTRRYAASTRVTR